MSGGLKPKSRRGFQRRLENRGGRLFGRFHRALHPAARVARCSPQKCSRPCGGPSAAAKRVTSPGPEIGPRAAPRTGRRPTSAGRAARAGPSPRAATSRSSRSRRGRLRPAASDRAPPRASPVIHAVRLVTSVGSSRLRAAASMPARVVGEQARRVAVLLPEPAASARDRPASAAATATSRPRRPARRGSCGSIAMSPQHAERARPRSTWLRA